MAQSPGAEAAAAEPEVDEFPALLTKTREAAGMTQQQLAVASDLAGSYISALERGVNKPSLGVVKRLAKALGTTVAALSGETAA